MRRLLAAVNGARHKTEPVPAMCNEIQENSMTDNTIQHKRPSSSDPLWHKSRVVEVIIVKRIKFGILQWAGLVVQMPEKKVS